MNKSPERIRIRNDLLARQLGAALALKELEVYALPNSPEAILKSSPVWSLTAGLIRCCKDECAQPDEVHFEYRMIEGRQKVRVRCFSCRTRTAWGQYPQEVANLWHKDKS